MTGENGTITLFLEPGTYKITETHKPEKTEQSKNSGENEAIIEVEASGYSDVTIVNTAPDIGGIQFTKKGSDGKSLEGAVFGLWKTGNPEKEDPDYTAVSGADGTVTFYPLDKGSYKLKEIKAPEGYVLDDSTTYNVTVKANQMVSVTDEEIINEKNEVTVTVNKLIKDFEKNTYVSIGNYPEAIGDFQGAFTIQRRAGESGQWEDVNGCTGLSLTEAGNIQKTLERYQLDPDTGAILATWQYCVIETVPAGYESVTTSEQTYENGKVTTTAYPSMTKNADISISVRNIPQGHIKLTKSVRYFKDADGQAVSIARKARSSGCTRKTARGIMREYPFRKRMVRRKMNGRLIKTAALLFPDWIFMTKKEI